jgi:hypothetical protein
VNHSPEAIKPTLIASIQEQLLAHEETIRADEDSNEIVMAFIKEY